MLSRSVQDYLKTIFKLQEGGAVSTTKISKELKVSGASVTGMLKRLSTMELVDYNSYKGVKLTEKGKVVALEIIRHHRLLELYLKEHLDFSLEKVHEEACRLEHYISEEFADKIDEIMGHPQFDPHGHPIPTKSGVLSEFEDKPLSEVEVGAHIQIKRLSDTDSQLLAYLEEMGLMPGVQLTVLEKAPFNGPVTVKFADETKIIGNEIAKNIFVILNCDEIPE